MLHDWNLSRMQSVVLQTPRCPNRIRPFSGETVNGSTQLCLGLDCPLPPEKVAQVHAKESREIPRRSYRRPEIETREWPRTPRFLSWQSERAWEVSINQFGPI